MLFFITLVSLIVFGTTCVFLLSDGLGYRNSAGKSNKAFTIILITCFALAFICSTISNQIRINVTKEQVTQVIPIQGIYKTTDNHYVIKDNKQDIYTITCYDICSGDSNYVVHSYYPNLTDTIDFLLGNLSKDTYKIVVTDTDIPYLENINYN